MATDEHIIASGAPSPARRAEDLVSSTYDVAPERFWTLSQLRGDDGYDRIGRAATRGWQAISAWGLEGWCLGSWPYAVVFHRDSMDGYELAYNVEGDVSVYRYPAPELREVAIDYLAFWHWKQDDEPWVEGIDTVDVAPAHLRGPFSWARLDASTEATS